jgi:hypothetical protein
MAAGLIGAITAAPELLKGIADLVDRFVPDPAQKAQAALDLQKLVTDREVAAVQAAADVAKAQIGVNAAEAQGNDRYSARWRPTAGWVCVAALAYQYVAAPLLTWATGLAGVMIGAAIPPAPQLNMTDLLPVLIGMLGLGVQRTIERTQGVPGAMPGGVKQ